MIPTSKEQQATNPSIALGSCEVVRWAPWLWPIGFYDCFPPIRGHQRSSMPSSTGTASVFVENSVVMLVMIEVTELARLLRINLDPETLDLCCQLLEEGANPEALAALLVQLQKETQRGF